MAASPPDVLSAEEACAEESFTAAEREAIQLRRRQLTDEARRIRDLIGGRSEATSPPDVLAAEEMAAIYDREAEPPFLSDPRLPNPAGLLAVAREAVRRERAAIVAGLRERASKRVSYTEGPADHAVARALRAEADRIERSG